MANICLAIIVLTTIVGAGCTIFGAVDYHDTMAWMKEQTEYLKEMENKRA